jgi:uncharacterized protein (TIGR03382 family)
VTAADVDGDGQQELVILAANDSDAGTQGEFQILDNVLDPLGPTVISTAELGPYVNNRKGVYLQNLGDIDLDGDDEVLLTLQNFLGSGLLAIIDAETWQDGLTHPIGDTMDIPLPPGVDMDIPWALVGDYNSDGLRDVALMMSWEASTVDEHHEGTIAIWLTTQVEAMPNPITADGSTSTEGPAAKEDPVSSGSSKGCGCGGGTPSGPWLALPLLALTRRKASLHP